MRNSVILIFTVLLTACLVEITQVSSPYFRIPVNSRVIVNTPITIPPQRARVYLQYGRVVSKPDQYYAHCWFLSWQVLPTEQIIAPDTFIVKDSQKNEQIVQRRTNIQLADRSSRLVSHDPGGGPTAVEYLTELFIHSDKQPDIRRLVCNHWGDPSLGEHLTFAEIQAALGDLVKIELHQK